MTKKVSKKSTTAKSKDGFKVTERRNGRFTVKKRGGKLVSGEAKVKVLLERGLIKKMKPKAKAEEAAAPEA